MALKEEAGEKTLIEPKILVRHIHTEELEFRHGRAKDRIDPVRLKGIVEFNTGSEPETYFVQRIKRDAIVLEASIDKLLLGL